MNILHISNKPVFPLVDGGCVAAASMLKALNGISVNVAHCYVHTPKHKPERSLYPAGTRFALNDDVTFTDTGITIKGAISSLLRRQNYNLARFFSPVFAKALQHYLMQQKPDVIVLESLFLVRYVKAIRSVSEATLVIRAHNVEYQLWEQQAEAAAFPKKSYLKHLAKTLRREELKGLNSVDQIWTITREDEQQLQKLGVTNPIVTIPVAVETGEKLPDYANTDFFHLGSLNWEPNKLAVRRLLKDIWPDFAERYQSTLHIAGAFSDDFTMEFVQRVKIHGFAEDAAAFMLEHGTLAAPVVSGSGVRIKLLEAMSLGIPCITTALGAAGIAHPEEQLRLAGTNAEWLAALTEFAASEDIRRNYGLRGRAYMEKYHSFASVTAQILAALGR